LKSANLSSSYDR